MHLRAELNISTLMHVFKGVDRLLGCFHSRAAWVCCEEFVSLDSPLLWAAVKAHQNSGADQTSGLWFWASVCFQWESKRTIQQTTCWIARCSYWAQIWCCSIVFFLLWTSRLKDFHFRFPSAAQCESETNQMKVWDYFGISCPIESPGNILVWKRPCLLAGWAKKWTSC